MNTKSPIEELREKKRANEDKIQALSSSISIYLSSISEEKRLYIEAVQEYLQERMVELEIQWQDEKIQHMQEVLDKIKSQ